MVKMTEKDLVNKLLVSVGVKVNGSDPTDIQVYNDHFYSRVVRHNALGLGESYMDGWWDCRELDSFFAKILHDQLDTKISVPFTFYAKQIFSRIINYQSKKRSKEVGEKHYDLGNELYTGMLDSNMIYSCGYWKNASNLEEAQLAKLELICQKLQLRPGMRVLDVGCGWGGFAKYAAENHGVNVIGITISQEQCEFAKNYCQGLPVEIRLQDYRDVDVKVDRIVSIGMFEHVGYLNYPVFMEKMREFLHEDGLFLLHTIGNNESAVVTNEWTNKYIFPNGMLPSISQIGQAIEKKFVMEDWHNFGVDYDKTLMAWHRNFLAHWDKIKSLYDERFYRMWCYYLLSSAGGFRARALQVWQLVLSKNGVLGGYSSVR